MLSETGTWPPGATQSTWKQSLGVWGSSETLQVERREERQRLCWEASCGASCGSEKVSLCAPFRRLCRADPLTGPLRGD